MTDRECVEFLRWCLPRLDFRWPGFRKVRKQVCKRIERRVKALRLSGPDAYRELLQANAEEWDILDAMCRITISRFYRDRQLFDAMRTTVLPGLARRAAAEGARELSCWSAGCGSGEEPYTVRIIWAVDVSPTLHPGLPLRIVATDSDRGLIERAREGKYTASSLKELPRALRDRAFDPTGDAFEIRDEFKENIEFLVQDIRRRWPDGHFHLVLCRNLVFTYFSKELQREVLGRIRDRLNPGGILFVGSQERLPDERGDFEPYPGVRSVYVRQSTGEDRGRSRLPLGWDSK